jgi:hypothetical protein
MISVVICSVNQELAQQVKSNIDKTIGVAWEAIVIDNRSPSRGITEVYNEGARRSRFSIICFVHEDVTFQTPQWGRTLQGYFEGDARLGMVGVAGSKYKSRTPSGWMTRVDTFDRCNIFHLNNRGQLERLLFGQSPPGGLEDVVVLDGVFLCARKEVITRIPFDQESLQGFHLYDIDISYRVSQQYRVAVSYGIDLVHYTEGGDFGNKWVEQTLRWHRKYEDQLPTGTGISRPGFSEYPIMRFWLTRLRSEKISLRRRLRWVKYSRAGGYVGLWPHIFIFVCFDLLRKLPGREKKKMEGQD